MGAAVGNNRGMFWRILRRQIFANRGRLFVVLLALAAGAAITAALLNLQIDAKRRLTAEFSVLGPNIVIVPVQTDSEAPSRATLDERILDEVPPTSPDGWSPVNASGYLYLVADLSGPTSRTYQPVVIAGVRRSLADKGVAAMRHNLRPPGGRPCIVGSKVAAQMHLQVGDQVLLHSAAGEEPCRVIFLRNMGDAGDAQVSPELEVAQRLAGLPGRISLVELTARGTSGQVNGYLEALRKRFPNAGVRGVYQFSEAQEKIYSKISGLLTATVVLVLVLTALCVMAAMTNVAMERRNDVGLMKAIGGATRRVVRLFLTEAALLGLVGGLVGAALGILLSMELGKAVFGVAARPRLIVYPIAVGLTILVAIASSFPLRRLAGVRPAAVFRGEA
jgi:putative ABC transport system permease protein